MGKGFVEKLLTRVSERPFKRTSTLSISWANMLIRLKRKFHRINQARRLWIWYLCRIFAMFLRRAASFIRRFRFPSPRLTAFRNSTLSSSTIPTCNHLSLILLFRHFMILQIVFGDFTFAASVLFIWFLIASSQCNWRDIDGFTCTHLSHELILNCYTHGYHIVSSVGWLLFL